MIVGWCSMEVHRDAIVLMVLSKTRHITGLSWLRAESYPLGRNVCGWCGLMVGGALSQE
jgi:hypothetical protein